MHKWSVLNRVTETGLVAVVRARSADEAVRIAEACIQGGVAAVEITFTVPGAAGAISAITQRYSSNEVLVGAGSVLDAETCRTALLAGAQFIVSPSLNIPTARMCGRYQVPYMPGAGTVTEVVRAMEEGADIVKVFPGEILGPGFVKAVRGPLPHAPLMPTGGVTLENAGEWIRAGCVAVGVGGNLTAGAQTGDFDSVTALARKFTDAIQAARRASAGTR